MNKCILFLWRYSPRRFAAAMLLTIVSGLSAIVLLAVANIVLQQKPISREIVIWSFVGLCISLPLSRFIAEILISTLAQRAVFDLQMRLARKIAGAPLRFLEDCGVNQLLAVLIQDLPVFGFSLQNVPVICLNLTVMAGGLFYLGWLSRMVLVIALGFMVLSLAIYRVPAARAARSLGLARQATDGLYYHFRSLLGGAKELKLHQARRRVFFSQVLHSSASSVRTHNVSGLTASSVAAIWAQISAFVLIGVLLLAVPLLKLNPQGRFGYTMVLIFMMAPLQVLLGEVSEFALAEVALDRIEGLEQSLSGFHTEPDSLTQDHPKCEFNNLDLVNATHVYHRDGEIHDFIVGPACLRLVPGEIVFLVGGNGSGKTTLAKLLAGLYVPAGGEIYLNGQIIADANRDYYRQHFSAVFSDFHLFDRLMGLECSQLDEQAKKYLTQLELDHKVAVNNGVLSTTKLSQGQCKRLALLTAYIEDRPIYIFDEWAADQDPSFKKIFYQTFLPELKAKGKAVLVISHDERYYHVADRVIRLDCGKILDRSLVKQTA